MQAALGKPTLGDLRSAAKVVDSLLADPDRKVVMKPVPLQDMHLVGFGDASYGKRPLKSRVIFATTADFLESKEVDVSLQDWKNARIAAAVGSTLSAETTSIKNLFGALHWLRSCYLDVLHAFLHRFHIWIVAGRWRRSFGHGAAGP